MSTPPSTEKLVAVVETDAGNVDVLLGRDSDGGQYVRITGNGCDLEGEQPGLYYPKARLADDLAQRANDGELVAVRCECGYTGSTPDTLLLADLYTQEAPPGPRGSCDWLEVRDPGRDEGRAAMFCPVCDADWPASVSERPTTEETR